LDGFNPQRTFSDVSDTASLGMKTGILMMTIMTMRMMMMTMMMTMMMMMKVMTTMTMTILMLRFCAHHPEGYESPAPGSQFS
jgi:hypothetical protein